MPSKYPLIGTKIRVPRRRNNLLSRERLLSYLHSNIQHKLVLISAPAGYGKTSLLIDYAHDTDLPVCWYSLDANDGHPLTFVEYLTNAIQARFPGFGDSLLEALGRHSGPVEAVEPFIRLFASELEQNTDEYFCIVLDDFHEVIDSEPVNAIVDGLLRYLPDHCHLILASRGIPRRLTLTRLAAKLEVVGIGMEHLRFTSEEIYALLKLLGRLDLTQEQADTLASRTEGWITGVLLAAQTDFSGMAHDILSITGSSGGVFDYMAEEILAQQTPELQRFLLGSALFREMSPPLCNALLGIENASELLMELVGKGLFTSVLDTEGRWFQYHQLFREFLQAKMQRDAPQEYHHLCLRQADIMVDRGHEDRAIDRYLEAEASDEAAKTLEIIVQDAFDAGKWDLLSDWMDALPADVIAQHPRLLLFRAKLHGEKGDSHRAIELLRQSRAIYEARDDLLGSARATVQLGTILRLRSQWSEAIEMCREALALADGRDAIVATQAHRNIGISHYALGDLDEGTKELGKALALAEANDDQVNAAYSAQDIGTAELYRGRPEEARRQYHRALMYWRRTGNASNLALTLQNLGVLHHHMGQYAESENRFQEAFAKADLAADARVKAYILVSEGDLYRDMGRYDDALAAYSGAAEVASQVHPFQMAIYLRSAQGDALRLKGEFQQAEQLLVEARDQADAQDARFDQGMCALASGALAYQQGDLQGASARLLVARQTLLALGSSRELGRALLYSAIEAQARGSQSEVREHMVQISELVRSLGSYQLLVAEGHIVDDLLRVSEASGFADLDYMKIRSELSLHFPQKAPPAIVSMRDLAAEVEFLGLMGGQVQIHGQVVTDWESIPARLMAFLFASFPEGLTREQVVEMLWPEVNPAKGQSRFHASLYRVRKALGLQDFVVRDQKTYACNPQIHIRYDVTEFQYLAELGLKSGDTAHLARIKAIDLYKTPFLEICEHEWCAELRRSLQSLALRLVLREGDYLATQDQVQDAEAMYVKSLGFDSYEEKAYRGIMWCRAKNNDRNGAILQFRECERILHKDLSVAPSRETQVLYQHIISDRAPAIPN